MKKVIFFIFLFLVLTLLQISFFNFTKIFPNLVLVVFLAILFFQKKNLKRGLFFTLLAGILLDIFSGSLFGVNILSLLFVYLFFVVILNLVFDANIIEAILLIFFGVILYNFSFPPLSFIMSRIFAPQIPLQFDFSYLNLINQAINFVLGTFLFFVILMSHKLTKFISAR